MLIELLKMTGVGVVLHLVSLVVLSGLGPEHAENPSFYDAMVCVLAAYVASLTHKKEKGEA